jgi:preprotein translocase subunit SecA
MANTTKKIGRNQPCPCGSGQKYKKCCMNDKEASNSTFSWADSEGIHHIAPGEKPSPKSLEKMTQEYQKSIRNSPLWDEMVKEFGEEKAKELLKEFKAEVR